ncbi:hypothetical protein BABA_21191 [Neobacillus bataviensis LMG 21833]|uniref:Glycoside hydrolase 123 catalytic domain-containing protein n=1 Tax=Neobacillus bataviensis LMG 21833 TaxID=1117379 RepID=K6DWG7_9BACI|nr:DUF4091 domain-containing protein [Neobacillus bataviensis]EKN65201.1 hypothetical protein BABA_21191 [Neobacillus bataviensis LMG 21833]
MVLDLITRCVSSLTKVFADQELKDSAVTNGSALLNESFSFQIAYKSTRLVKDIRVRIQSTLKEKITVRSVGLAPSEFPCYHDHDDLILRITPGLYPDPLYPLDKRDGLTAFPEQWRAIWITVDLQGDVDPGRHLIEVNFEKENREYLGREMFELEVIAAELPEQQLIHTEWFHTDCLATYYNVDIFSEEHWRRIEQFVQTAVKHGMNMILTPLFTPPLDTEVGGERPTVQLVDVEKSGDTYHFRFDTLRRWIELCRNAGITYFEFSHLFTQWGAKHAPKIIGYEKGEQKQFFGWDTDAAGDEYRQFLHQFLPCLIDFIKQNGLEHRVFFHVSDEPHLDQVESYQNASEILQTYVKDFPVIDALSDYTFYEKGLVKTPIPSNDHIQPFLDNGVENLWTYHCCVQYKKVANRFFNMPSFRNRVLGMQLYKFNIAGFLHWGYNFWYSQYSKKPIDPFRNTDAHYAFPSGDAFLVYPGEEGPIESIRLEVLHEALQDLRALQLLESFIGREQVLELLEEGLDGGITFEQYPLNREWYLLKREEINEKIKENL